MVSEARAGTAEMSLSQALQVPKHDSVPLAAMIANQRRRDEIRAGSLSLEKEKPSSVRVEGSAEEPPLARLDIRPALEAL
jgi:hypothetical protein